MFRPLHTRFHAQESAAERTTFPNASGGYRAHISQHRHRDVRTRVIGEIENRAEARLHRDTKRGANADEPGHGGPGLLVAPSRFELPLPP